MEWAIAMRRREFIALVSGAVALPMAALAQQRERTIRRIGVLSGRSEDAELRGWIMVLKQRLEQLGWRENDTFRIDLRSGEIETSSALAGALVASSPDVIIAIGNPGVVALQRETRSIPIVFTQVGDPVGSGFVASLARPGGNITGFMHYEPAMGSKWLEILMEIAPGLKRALVLLFPEVKANVEFARAAEAAGSTLQLAVSSAGIHNAGDIERAVTTFAREPKGGLIVLPNPVGSAHRTLINDLANSPSPARDRGVPLHGGEWHACLLRCGCPRPVSARGDLRRSHPQGEKTGRFARAGTDQVRVGDQFKTARALGLTMPPSLLARADEVIE